MRVARIALWFCCAALIVAGWLNGGFADDYPKECVGAKVSTKWNDDRSQCKVAVEIQNLTRDRMQTIPDNTRRQSYLAFPDILRSSMMSEVGKPEMPFVKVNLEVPAKSEASIVIDKIEKTAGWEGIDIVPAQAPWPEIRGASEPSVAPNAKIYGRNRFFPYLENVVLGPKGEFRGTSFQTVLFYPLRFNPVLRALHLSKIEITIHLSFEGGAAREAWKEASQRSRKGYSSQSSAKYLALVQGFTPPSAKDLVRKPEAETGCNYLVIVQDSLEKELQPLLDLKRRRQLSVKVANFSSLGIKEADGPESRRTKIRSRIEAEYRLAPKPSYLLLVGDAGAIPPYLKDSHPAYQNEKVATDLFYGTLDQSPWIPSISIGRLPARNPEDLRAMVSKIAAYEKALDEHAAEKKWGRALVASLYQNEIWFFGNQKKTTTKRWFHQTAYNVGRFFQYAGDSSVKEVNQLLVADQPDLPKPWLNCDGSEIPDEVMKQFCSNPEALKTVQDKWTDLTRLVLHRDHAAREGWGDPPFGVNEAAKLKKPQVPPVVFSINCESGWYDHSSNQSLALELMRNPNGASAVVAASRISYSRYNDRFTEGLIQAAWPTFVFDFELPDHVEARRIGDTVDYARTHLLKSYDDETAHLTVQLFNLFGDPEMRLRAHGTSERKPAPEAGRREVPFAPSFAPNYR
ncbi:MAG: C25 family cysteine peptidase [Thermodesulfobacteriota bacterium]